jgi:Mce-associated membrane protein
VLLCLLTLALGAFAGWAHARAESLRDDPATRNTALTDAARTSEIKGQTAKAVAALFSYDHADPAAFEKAARELLTGRAVAQHRTLLDAVRAGARQQKAVITTTVTDSAVERIDGDRARVLVYADQSSVSTAGTKDAAGEGADRGTYAGAMLAVDVVLRDGRWLVSGIDTFGR